MSELSDQIKENAAKPQSVTNDGTSVTTHSLRDQIEADKYLRRQSAGSSKRLPIRMAKITPGGAV